MPVGSSPAYVGAITLVFMTVDRMRIQAAHADRVKCGTLQASILVSSEPAIVFSGHAAFIPGTSSLAICRDPSFDWVQPTLD